MYVGRCELQLPTSGTREHRLRNYLVSSVRCPRVETDLAAAVLSSVLNLDQSILGSALELLRTSRSDDQQRATRVGLATNVAQRHVHELAHAPSESGARHSRDLRGGPREREVEHVPLLAVRASLNHARMARMARTKLTPGEVRAGARWGWVMSELTPRGHLRPLGGRENPRRARPESRSPRRCASAWRRCLLFAGRSRGLCHLPYPADSKLQYRHSDFVCGSEQDRGYRNMRGWLRFRRQRGCYGCATAPAPRPESSWRSSEHGNRRESNSISAGT
jgi:hypothetical protein